MSSQQSAISDQSMSLEEMQIRRAQVRSEFDHLMWRKRRLDERLDALAKDIDDLGTEIAAEMIRRAAPKELAVPRKALKMEIV